MKGPNRLFEVVPPNPEGLCLCGCGETTAVSKTTQTRRGVLKGEHVRYIKGHWAKHVAREISNGATSKAG
jgi:hypothetical protein